ncbi:hypothetical protein FRB99_001748 [Tulasnella sp. 403]|nr:hypothetical protein FRB99_001748 [Tulasnella sp. 403]
MLTRSMRKRHNRISLAYIHRLPPEILQLVLTLSLPDFHELEEEFRGPTRRYYRELLQLCGVSPDWASFIRSTPSFWTYTSQTDCDELTGAILARSKNSPLRVRYIMYEGCPCRENHSYLETIVAQSHRWRALRVYTGSRRVLEGFLAAPAPQLRYLDVGNMSESPVPTVDLTTSPQIVDIYLAHVLLDWTAHRFSGLQSLHLRDVAPGPTLEQLLDVIRGSPNLHTLAMFDCDVAVGSYEFSKVEPSSSLTSCILDVLKLSQVSAPAICGILSCVTIHDQSNLFLDVSDSPAPNRGEAETIATFAFKHIGSLAPWYVALKITDSDCNLDSEGGNWCIVLPCTEGGTIEELVHFVNEHLTKTVPELHNVPAALRLDIQEVDVLLPIMSVIANLLNVIELVFIAPSQMSVLEPLASPLPSGKWLFPNLEVLRVSPYEVVVDETLPNVVRARWTASRKAKRGGAKPTVVPIKSVSIEWEGTITRRAWAWLTKTKLIEDFEVDPEILVV